MEGKEELKEKIIGRINCIKSRFPNDKLNLVEEQINSKFSHLLSNEANEWSAEVSSAAELAQYIDHTILKADATSDDITTLCEQAKDFGFKAVCVNGSRSQFAKTLLSNSEVKVAAVVGFPLGASSSKTKQSECEEQINDFQVHEIDVVINIGDLKDANYEKIYLELSALSLICHPRAILKVILECGALTKEEIIDASIIAILADADYIKTSTGFGNYGGAVIEDVKVMRMIAGPNKHVKASGGIRSAKSALDFIHAGADRIGTSSGPLIISQFKEMVSQQK